jgi:hypothetical protein
MGLSYASNDYNIGSPGGGTPLSKAVALWVCTPGTHFDTMALAAVKANVLAQVATGAIIPLNRIDSEEIKDSENNITETDTGNIIKNWEGLKKRIYTFTNSLDTHKKLRTLNGGEFCAYIFDKNGLVCGTSSDGTLFEPFTLSFLDVHPQKEGAGFTTNIEVVFADPTEWNDKGKFFKAAYSANSIEPVYAATITTQTVVAANVCTVTVKYVSTSEGDNAGVLRNVPIVGLAKENFLAYNTAAPTVPLTPSSAVDASGLGIYVLTFSAFTGGPLSVIPTATNLYKSVAVTITA